MNLVLGRKSFSVSETLTWMSKHGLHGTEINTDMEPLLVACRLHILCIYVLDWLPVYGNHSYPTGSVFWMWPVWTKRRESAAGVSREISLTPHHQQQLQHVSQLCRWDACIAWMLITFSEGLPRGRTVSSASWVENTVLITECSTQPRVNTSHNERNGTQNPNVLTPLIIPFIMLWRTNWRKWEHLWKNHLHAALLFALAASCWIRSWLKVLTTGTLRPPLSVSWWLWMHVKCGTISHAEHTVLSLIIPLHLYVL